MGPLVGGRSGKLVTRRLAAERDLVLDIARRDCGGRFDVIADGGCGKTLLLEELADGLRDLGYATLFITISPQREDGGLSETDRMRGDEDTYHQIIADLVSDIRTAYANPAGKGRAPLSAKTGRRIEQRMLAAKQATPESPASAPAGVTGRRPAAGTVTGQQVSAGRDAYVAGRDLHAHPTESDLLRGRSAASLRAFAEVMWELAGQCPVAVLVDDLHLILGTGAGQWLLAALDQLPVILAVHARRPDPTHLVLGRAQVMRLAPMSQEEARAYTRHKLPGWAPAHAVELGSLVFELTGGYPVWVDAICQMIATKTAQGVPADQVKRELREGVLSLSAQDLTTPFGRFVDDYCARLLGATAPVFDLLTILRRISRHLLASLLAGHNVDGSACGRLFDWLKESGFMTIMDDGGPSDSGEPEIRLHDAIRHQAERLLREHRLTRYQELHALVERYYRKAMNFDREPEEGVSPYQYGTRYEEPDWQVDSLEWLHHAGQVADEAFARAGRAMIRLFLDAFWWYECDFPLRGEYHYCQALLADYRALPARRSGQQWLRYLEAFRENYVANKPDRWPGLDRERWQRAQDALRGLWYYLRLDRAKIPDDHDLRRIQILVSYFRGDAEYFGGTGDGPSRDRAVAWYTGAEQAASRDEDDRWIANWAVHDKASLYVDTDPARARELIQDLPQRIDEQADNELRVHLIWLYGDLAWKAGDKALAFDIYARAVLHAFVYHVRQEHTPQNPSGYTVEYCQMFMDWTRRRLDEARRGGLGELVSVATGRMNALFAPYWARMGRLPDNAEGFPSQPARADLGTVDSEFAETVLWVLDEMGARLQEPLDGPLFLD